MPVKTGDVASVKIVLDAAPPPETSSRRAYKGPRGSSPKAQGGQLLSRRMAQPSASQESEQIQEPMVVAMNKINLDCEPASQPAVGDPTMTGATLESLAPLAVVKNGSPSKPAAPTSEAGAADAGVESSPLDPLALAAPSAQDAAPAVFQVASRAQVNEITAATDKSTPSDAPAAASSPANRDIQETTDAFSLKDLPKVATEAANQAGEAYVEAGWEAQGTIKSLLSLRDKEGPPITFTLDQILTAAFLAVAAFQLLLLPVFMPSLFRLAYSLVWGLLLGLGLSFLFYRNRKRKAEVNELLGINLGMKGLQLVAAGLPAMFSVSDNEKMEWLNALIVEVWPFVDKAVCEQIKETTAQVMPGILQMLPVGLSGLVKSIGFKHLTFGGAPVRVESIWVSPEDKDRLVLELAVKWCGDPNITLAIELPKGQKLCPRIMDITLVATVRLVLGPLVPRMPGFVAALATLPKPPLINYRLDFGKALGGSVAPVAVAPVINYFIRDVVDKMLVWPGRLVVPVSMVTQEDVVDVQRLMRRHRGVLRVQVVRGRALDQLGPFDKACAVLTTDSEHSASTRPCTPTPPPTGPEAVKHPPTGPVVWNETLHLLIQEPESQLLRLEVFDLTAGRMGRALEVSGRRLVGRAAVKLGKVCRAAMRGEVDPAIMVAQLGKNSWGSPGGPGKGYGKVTLRMSYFPFESITREQLQTSKKGIVTVRIGALRGIAPLGPSVSVHAAVTTTADRREGRPAFRTAKKHWSLRAHTESVRARIQTLQAQLERDRQGGRHDDAQRTSLRLDRLRVQLENDSSTAPVVNVDYQFDSFAVHVLYDVPDRVPESGEANHVVIRVVREGRGVKTSQELVGMAEVPIEEVRNAATFNPLSGHVEYGLWLKGVGAEDWFHPRDPLDLEDWGLPLAGGSGARVLALIRYSPCIELPDDTVPADEDEGEDTANPAAAPAANGTRVA